MMQSNEIEQRFNTIERSIEQLKQTVQGQQNLPQDLKDCVQQLGQETQQARQVLQSHDEQRIVACVDSLENLSDRAKAATGGSTDIDEGVKRAVMDAHRELSSLKHQLH